MTRRDFFKNFSIGAVAIPAVVQGVRPLPLPVLTVRGVMSGISGYYQKVIIMSNSVLKDSVIRLPWNATSAIEVSQGTQNAVVTGNVFKWDQAPFFMRILNLTRGY
jgi:hypothetical protein